MSPEATVYALLSPLVGGRCYPDKSPSGTVFPLIIYQQVGGVAIDYFEGKVADKDNARIQVNVWAKTRKEASQLARSARVALVEGYAKATTMGAAVALYNDDMEMCGTRQDFSVWGAP